MAFTRPLDVVHEIVVLLTGAPPTAALRDELLALQARDGHWGGVAAYVESHVAGLLSANPGDGAIGVIQRIAENGLDLRLTSAQAGDVLAAFEAGGLNSWTARIAHIVTQVQGAPAQALDNRAALSQLFLDALTARNRAAWYQAPLELGFAREWLQGVGAEAQTRQLAEAGLDDLLSHFGFSDAIYVKVADGSLAGATVLIDVNRNDVHESSDASATTYDHGLAGFHQSAPAGPLRISSGFDRTTGLGFGGILTAPEGAVVVSHLTSVLQHLLLKYPLTTVAAEARLFGALNLQPVDLSTYDPTLKISASAGTFADRVLALRMLATSSQLDNLVNVGRALIEGEDASFARNHVLASLAEHVGQGGTATVDLSDGPTLGAVLLEALREALVITGITAPAELARLTVLSTQAGAAVANINRVVDEVAQAFADGAIASWVDALSDVYKLQWLAHAELAAAVRNNTAAALEGIAADYSGLELFRRVMAVDAKQFGNVQLNDGNYTALPQAPVLALQADTGRSGFDRITSDGRVHVGNLKAGATWEYSTNGGASWTRGNGTSLVLSGDGAKALLVRQSDSFGNVSASSAVLHFTLDTVAPARPVVALVNDTGFSASDGLTNDGELSITGLDAGATVQYSSTGGGFTFAAGRVRFTGEGAKTLAVTQSDAAGNASAAGTLSFTLYTEPPALALLDGTTGFTLAGAARYDMAGNAVSSAGDVNGDGYADVIVGAPFADGQFAAQQDAGAAYVVFGKAAGFAAALRAAELSGSNGFRIAGAQTSQLGLRVGGAGDFNGDGYADVLVSNGRLGQVGATYVVFGRAADFTATLDVATLDGSNGLRIDGVLAEDRAGVVANAGDVNGDGYADIIIGAPYANTNGEAAGAAYVVYGSGADLPATFALANLNGRNGFRLVGAARGDLAGVTVSGAGDVNGDGFADLLVGARHADPNGRQLAGSTFVVFGKVGGFAPTTVLSELDGSNGFRINGEFADDLSGSAVSAAGDVNGDGFGDLLVGAPQADAGGGRSGASYVIFGKASGFSAELHLLQLDERNGFRFDGVRVVDYSGSAVSGAGDIDGDGYADLLIGSFLADPAHTEAGTAAVIRGGFGSVTKRSGGAAADTLTGTSAVDNFVAGGGNDTLLGGGGADVFHGGAGADRIVVGSTDFRLIDGGSGSDTLAVAGSGLNAWLAGARGRITGIERLDLTGSGNNTLHVTALDVLNLSATSNTVVIDGNAGDRVFGLSSGWSDGGVSEGYQRFTQGAAVLLVGVALATDFPL